MSSERAPAIHCPACGHRPRPGVVFRRFSDLQAITQYVERGDDAPPIAQRCASCGGGFEVSARQLGALLIEHRQHLLMENIAGLLRRQPRYQQ